jgi:hypothetical protein
LRSCYENNAVITLIGASGYTGRLVAHELAAASRWQRWRRLLDPGGFLEMAGLWGVTIDRDSPFNLT